MSADKQNITSEVELTPMLSNTSIVNDPLKSILQKYNLVQRETDHYMEVGEIPNIRGWVLYLSVIPMRLIELLEIVAPILFESKISFKYIKNDRAVSLIINGGLGFQSVGKMICIYPPDNNSALNCAQQLIPLTKVFEGPVINTARNLGSIIYTRFVAFKTINIFLDNGGTKAVFAGDPASVEVEEDATPFRIPEGQSWPFYEMVSPMPPPRPKLLNYAYLPYALIVGNIKGNVKKGKYFKHWWLIKTCLIKQGKQHIFVDEQRRDIRDRLQWQFELYRELKNVIPMPEVFDYWIEYGDAYLAMKYLHWPQLEDFIRGIYQKKAWLSLSNEDKISLVETALELSQHIEAMHNRGFVHRDITTVNFLIRPKRKASLLTRIIKIFLTRGKVPQSPLDKRKRIAFIDLELTWNYRGKFPMEPFQAGTAGYMSPEQENGQVPATEQDIFALGALMIALFTGLPPTKFYRQTLLNLENSLTFLIQNKNIVQLIIKCMSPAPAERTAIKVLKDTLTRIHATIQQGPEEFQIQNYELEVNKISEIIQATIKGLVHRKFLSPDQLWLSKMGKKNTWLVNDFNESIIVDNLHTGLAGIMFQISSLQSFGFDTTSCTNAYEQSWLYIQGEHLTRVEDNNEGYYFGSAGIALALLAGMKSHLLKIDETNINFLKQTLSRQIADLDWANGISGQIHVIIQLLKCRSELKIPTNWAEVILHNHVNRLIKEQLADGSWNTLNFEKIGVQTGWKDGVAGIIAVLLEYLDLYEKPTCIAAVLKALLWLKNQRKVKKGKSHWYQSTKTKELDMWGLDNGMPGIALCLFRAYEYFKNQELLTIAEEVLEQLPTYPNRSTFSLEKGLAGLGFVYQEAYRITQDAKWRKKADYILLFFVNTFNRVDDGTGYWFMEYGIQTKPDLFTGVSGILFLLQEAISSFKGAKASTTIKLY